MSKISGNIAVSDQRQADPPDFLEKLLQLLGLSRCRCPHADQRVFRFLGNADSDRRACCTELDFLEKLPAATSVQVCVLTDGPLPLTRHADRHMLRLLGNDMIVPGMMTGASVTML